MADAEETAAQRQARIRRQKREAKIAGTAAERLDKITRLSGRTPETSMSSTEFTLRYGGSQQADMCSTVRNESPAPIAPPTSPPLQGTPSTSRRTRCFADTRAAKGTRGVSESHVKTTDCPNKNKTRHSRKKIL